MLVDIPPYIYIWDNPSHWLIYFKMVIAPPTRKWMIWTWTISCFGLHRCARDERDEWDDPRCRSKVNSSTTQRACAMQKIPPGRSLSSSATHQVVAGSLYSGCVVQKRRETVPKFLPFTGFLLDLQGFGKETICWPSRASPGPQVMGPLKRGCINWRHWNRKK